MESRFDSIGFAVIEHLIDDTYLPSEIAAAILIGDFFKRLIVHFNHAFAYIF